MHHGAQHLACPRGHWSKGWPSSFLCQNADYAHLSLTPGGDLRVLPQQQVLLEMGLCFLL